MNQARVRVVLSPRGAWEVVLPERVERLRCKTLEEASRMAHGLAAARRPCELIVHDAYHRVVEHELIQLGTETLTAIGAAVALREPGRDAAESRGEEADDSQTPRSDQSRAGELPLAGYDALSAVAITKRLSHLSPAGCRRSMPTNRAIATARRSASASPLYSLLPRAPPTRLRNPWGRRTRRPSPTARQDQPSPRTPLQRDKQAPAQERAGRSGHRRASRCRHSRRPERDPGAGASNGHFGVKLGEARAKASAARPEPGFRPPEGNDHRTVGVPCPLGADLGGVREGLASTPLRRSAEPRGKLAAAERRTTVTRPAAPSLEQTSRLVLLVGVVGTARAQHRVVIKGRPADARLVAEARRRSAAPGLRIASANGPGPASRR